MNTTTDTTKATIRSVTKREAQLIERNYLLKVYRRFKLTGGEHFKYFTDRTKEEAAAGIEMWLANVTTTKVMLGRHVIVDGKIVWMTKLYNMDESVEAEKARRLYYQNHQFDPKETRGWTRVSMWLGELGKDIVSMRPSLKLVVDTLALWERWEHTSIGNPEEPEAMALIRRMCKSNHWRFYDVLIMLKRDWRRKDV